MTFFDYGETDFIMCEFCQQDRVVDIHHLEGRGMGGSNNKDYIENLMGLCRDCHINCNDSSFNMYVRVKHLENVMVHIVSLIQLEKRLNENRKDKNK